MRLHSYWRSSCSYRVRIALNYKGLNYEYAPVHLVRDGGQQHQAQFLAKNPLAQVPTLDFILGGREVSLSQSLAILEYLDERYPQPPLLPKNLFLRARARQLAEIVNSGIQPLQNNYVLVELGRHDVDAGAWCRHFISRGLAGLERLASQTAGAFSVGDEPSMADVCLVPQLYNARRAGIDTASFATLAHIEAACSELEAFQKAHPDRQPDRDS